MNVLRIRKLRSGYRRGILKQIEVLTDITLDLEKEHIYGLVGANGAGKTTLFKTVVGLIPDYKGEIRIFGKDRAGAANQWLAKTGYVSEQALLPDYLSADRFLRIYGGILFSTGSELRNAIKAILASVGLTPHRYEKIETYSKGMKKRLMMAHALLADPDLLILDEPFEGLDPIQRINIKNILRAYRKKGKTVWVSSHELYELENLCDSVMLLDEGAVKMVASGEHMDLLEQFMSAEGCPPDNNKNLKI